MGARRHGFLAVVALFVSHGYSFLTNYVAQTEYRRVTLLPPMPQLQARAVVAHMPILLGGPTLACCSTTDEDRTASGATAFPATHRSFCFASG